MFWGQSSIYIWTFFSQKRGHVLLSSREHSRVQTSRVQMSRSKKHGKVISPFLNWTEKLKWTEKHFCKHSLLAQYFYLLRLLALKPTLIKLKHSLAEHDFPKLDEKRPLVNPENFAVKSCFVTTLFQIKFVSLFHAYSFVRNSRGESNCKFWRKNPQPPAPNFKKCW